MSLEIYKSLFMVELLIAEFVFCFRLKRKKNYWYRYLIGVVVCMAAAFLFPVVYYNALYTSGMFIVLFGVTLLMMRFCYDEPWANLLFCGIAAYTERHLAFQFYNLIGQAIEAGAGVIAGREYVLGFGSFYGNTATTTLPLLGLTQVFMSLIYFDTYLLVYWLCFVCFGRALWKHSDLRVKNMHFLALIGVVILIDVILNAVLVYIDEGYNLLYTFIMYGYNILCCLLTLYMQYSMVNEKELQKELTIVRHLWELDREHYESAKEHIALINLKCHDLKYQIRTIVSSGNNVPVDEIENLISIYDSTVRTGNEALDVILTEKSLSCRNNHIRLTCIADGASMSFMDEVDIYTLFGNVLDNAMEAVLKIEDTTKRVISLTARKEKGVLAINVSNFYEGEIVMEDGLPVTTKKEKNFHGFGMKSIRMLVEKYDGDLQVTARDGVFNLNIVLLAPAYSVEE